VKVENPVFLFIEVFEEGRRGASFPTYRGEVSRLFYWFWKTGINEKSPLGGMNGLNILR
jgi:hypothetical protein